MNVKRFIARSSREALNQVRMAFGADAVVLSNKPCDAGVEVLAMAPEGIAQIEQVAAEAPRAVVPTQAAAKAATASATQAPVEQDVQRLAMSTLSFQDYVRERLLRRRRAAMQPEAPETVMPTYEERHVPVAAAPSAPTRVTPQAMPPVTPQAMPAAAAAPARPIAVPAVREQPLRLPESMPSLADPSAAQREQAALMNEL